MFNVQKENTEPISVKLSEPKPKFVLLASPTIKQPSIYELMKGCYICRDSKYVESKYLQSSCLIVTLLKC